MSEAKPGFLRPTNLDSAAAKPFWQALGEGRLLARCCAACGEQFFPPRPRCPECLSADLDWIELSGRGTLHSWTEVHMSSPDFDTPFLLGLIDLEEGMGRLAARISDVEPEDLVIGMPLRVLGSLSEAGSIYSLVHADMRSEEGR